MRTLESLVKASLFFLTVFMSINSYSADRIIQILHTNDLHSHWLGPMEKSGGGHAKIKVLMDKLEAEGNEKGWVTVRLDAGDFSEGHIHYFANRGDVSFQIMKMMNYDAIALGNHDYLTGSSELERQVREGRDLPLVAANFIWRGHNTNIKPGRVISRGGLKIAVGGATTDEMLYAWAAAPATIKKPAEVLDNWLSQQRADLKIALTHIGLESDKSLVQQTSNIDVVIGGHSHTRMDEPFWAFNKENKKVIPIVQTGEHGSFLGQTIIKIPSRYKTEVVSYKLFPITIDMPEDSAIAELVHNTRQSMAQIFNINLEEVVAESEGSFPTYGSSQPPIGNFLADTLRSVASTDVAMDFGNLYGKGIKEGPATAEDILMLQPHIYDWNSGGWRVMAASILGSDLKTFVQITSLISSPIYLSGVKVKLDRLRGVESFEVNGQPLVESKRYSLAVSEGLLAGVAENPIAKFFIKPPYRNTGTVFRDALYNKIVETRNITRDFFGPRRITWPGSGGQKSSSYLRQH